MTISLVGGSLSPWIPQARCQPSVGCQHNACPQAGPGRAALTLPGFLGPTWAGHPGPHSLSQGPRTSLPRAPRSPGVNENPASKGPLGASQQCFPTLGSLTPSPALPQAHTPISRDSPSLGGIRPRARWHVPWCPDSILTSSLQAEGPHQGTTRYPTPWDTAEPQSPQNS